VMFVDGPVTYWNLRNECVLVTGKEHYKNERQLHSDKQISHKFQQIQS
jgi:hypothetical protein